MVIPRISGASLLLLTLLAGCATAPPIAAPAPDAAPAITADGLRRHVDVLAHDSLRGRDTGTPGIASAARYLVQEVQGLGLEPAGDNGSYYHSVALQRRSMDAQSSVDRNGVAVSLPADGLIAASGMVGLPATSRTSGGGELIYGGHIVDPSVVDDLTPEDLAGAVVIVRIAPPAGVDPQTTPPRMQLASLLGPGSNAAAVLLVGDEAQPELWAYAANLARNGSVELIPDEAPQHPDAPAFFLVSSEWAESVLGSPLAEERQPRTGLGTFQYTLQERVQSIEAWNIAAVLPGSDPARAGQYVSLGAHYDHVGVGAPVNGDSIFNGADDNASGTAALLKVAQQLTAMGAEHRPARSVLFLWYTAEEHGLLGSRAFADQPTVPRDSILVNINADMLGRNSPDSLFVVGAGRLSSELAREVESANERLNHSFIFDYSFDRPDHPERIFCRSDHYSFARHSIPIVFFTSGLHEDYHQPSDTAEKIEYEKLARVSTMVADLTRTLADREHWLTIDQPVDQAGAECMM